MRRAVAGQAGEHHRDRKAPAPDELPRARDEQCRHLPPRSRFQTRSTSRPGSCARSRRSSPATACSGTAPDACRTRSASMRSASPARARPWSATRIRAPGSSAWAASAIRPGLRPTRPRRPDDEGSLYTFDPAASLTVELVLPAKGIAELVYATGHARDEVAAADIIAALTGVAPIGSDTLRQSLGRLRAFSAEPLPPAETWPFHFTREGALHLTEKTPRPWAHVIANPVGLRHGGVQRGRNPFLHGQRAPECPDALPFRIDPDGAARSIDLRGRSRDGRSVDGGFRAVPTDRRDL